MSSPSAPVTCGAAMEVPEALTRSVSEVMFRLVMAEPGADTHQYLASPHWLEKLGSTELAQFGLSGTNAVQDDLDRITLMRQCGEDFVRRRDAFMRAVDADFRRSVENAAESFALVATTEDCQEGLNAFVEKRTPNYRGR